MRAETKTPLRRKKLALSTDNIHATKASLRGSMANQSLRSQTVSMRIGTTAEKGSFWCAEPHSRPLWPKKTGPHLKSGKDTLVLSFNEEQDSGAHYKATIACTVEKSTKFLKINPTAVRFKAAHTPPYVVEMGPGKFQQELSPKHAGLQRFSRLDDRFLRPSDAYETCIGPGDFEGAESTAHLPATNPTMFFPVTDRFPDSRPTHAGGGQDVTTSIRGEVAKEIKGIYHDQVLTRQLPWEKKRDLPLSELNDPETGHKQPMAVAVAAAPLAYASAFRSTTSQHHPTYTRPGTTPALGPGAYGSPSKPGVAVKQPGSPSHAFAQRGSPRLRATTSRHPYHTVLHKANPGVARYMGSVAGTHDSARAPATLRQNVRAAAARKKKKAELAKHLMAHGKRRLATASTSPSRGAAFRSARGSSGSGSGTSPSNGGGSTGTVLSLSPAMQRGARGRTSAPLPLAVSTAAGRQQRYSSSSMSPTLSRAVRGVDRGRHFKTNDPTRRDLPSRTRALRRTGCLDVVPGLQRTLHVHTQSLTHLDARHRRQQRATATAAAAAATAKASAAVAKKQHHRHGSGGGSGSGGGGGGAASAAMGGMVAPSPIRRRAAASASAAAPPAAGASSMTPVLLAAGGD